MHNESQNAEYEYTGKIFNGFAMLFLLLAIIILCGVAIVYTNDETAAINIPLILIALSALYSFKGLFSQEPNESRVMIFFGKYKGTCRKVGFYWVNPFMTCKKVSLRIQNMDIEPIKVNDKIGNPVLIGMVLVWKIKDTYRVTFDLDSAASPGSKSINHGAAERFVRVQSDAALREVTSKFAYDQVRHENEEEITLRDGSEIINQLLEDKINDRLDMAGMEVVEARINYLAYAPEIAAVMLRRQQASAIISAREKIVEGAVSMVDLALKEINSRGMVKLDEAHKASIVGNLLMVLCSDEPATPVLNTNPESI